MRPCDLLLKWVGCLKCKKFTSATTYSSPYRLTPYFPSLSPRVCTVSVRSYADVITKFSQMDRLPNFLNYGAPLVRRSTIKFCGCWSEIFSTSKQRRAISNHPHFHVWKQMKTLSVFTTCVDQYKFPVIRLDELSPWYIRN